MNEKKNKLPECANAPGRGFTAEEVCQALRVCRTSSIKDCDTCPADDYCLEIEEIAADLIEAQAKRIKELEEELRWISVTERMPEHNTAVMVYAENTTIRGGKTVHIGLLDAIANVWFLRTQPGTASFPFLDWKVTHWKPMPKGPEA